MRESKQFTVGTQTSPSELVDLQSVNALCRNYGQELAVMFRMLKAAHAARTICIGGQVYDGIKAELDRQASLSQQKLEQARIECRHQLLQAIRDMRQVQEDYITHAVNCEQEKLENELTHHEDRASVLAHKLRELREDEERLIYALARSHQTLQRLAPLGFDEIAVDGVAQQMAEIVIKRYEGALSAADEEIFELRLTLSELEDSLDQNALIQPSIRPLGSLGARRRRSSAGSQPRAKLRPARRESGTKGLGPVLESIADDDSSLADSILHDDDIDELDSEGAERPDTESEYDENERELEERHMQQTARLHDLKESHNQEMDALRAERSLLLRTWEARVQSLQKLLRAEHVQRVCQRQELLLSMARRVHKRRPPCDKDVTVYTKGLTFEMLQEEERRRADYERRRKEDDLRRLHDEEERTLLLSRQQSGEGLGFPMIMRGRSVSKKGHADDGSESMFATTPRASQGFSDFDVSSVIFDAPVAQSRDIRDSRSSRTRNATDSQHSLFSGDPTVNFLSWQC
ncbi:hypothetical protein BC832DRAFT_589125 [Gaertneriomyces semiglobifer]|nr:hypothetical protein BC832DRAFT_589125 [Gaertneriomyces semiglobifer]